MRFIKPVTFEDINSASSNIYHLPEHNLELIIMIMDILSRYGEKCDISTKEKEKLIELSKLGKYFF